MSKLFLIKKNKKRENLLIESFPGKVKRTASLQSKETKVYDIGLMKLYINLRFQLSL